MVVNISRDFAPATHFENLISQRLQRKHFFTDEEARDIIGNFPVKMWVPPHRGLFSSVVEDVFIRYDLNKDKFYLGTRRQNLLDDLRILSLREDYTSELSWTPSQTFITFIRSRNLLINKIYLSKDLTAFNLWRKEVKLKSPTKWLSFY